MRIITGNQCDPDATHRGLLSTLSQQTAFGLVTLDNVGSLIAEFGIDATRLAMEEFGRRSRSFLRDNDTLIEFSESRVYYVLADLNDVNHLLLAALKLERLFEWSFETGKFSMPLDVRVGWVYCDASEFSAEENKPQLYKRAEQARRQAITSGARYEIQSTRQVSTLSVEPDVNNALPGDIDTQDIMLDYQGKYCLDDGVQIGVEAQVRWRRNGSIIPQTDFVPLLSTEALWQMTRHCVRTVIRDSLSFSTECSVAIKIDRTCLNTNLITLIQEELAMWSVPASRLMIEIADSVLVGDSDDESKILGSLRDIGVKISIANFGGAYSSLQSIRNLCADEIKLDRTFIHNITEDEANQKFTQTLIDLCHRFSTPVVAEGIENGETVAWLIEAGCDAGQGFYLGAPMSKDRFALLVH